MKKLFIICAAILLCALCSCTKQEFSPMHEAKMSQVINESTALENFSIALSKAVCQYEEVRTLLKNEALKQFDNDYDVLYNSIKSHNISNSETFHDVMAKEIGSLTMLEEIERMLPTLTIYVTDVRWLDPNGFCPENWDTKDARVAVSYQGSNNVCRKLFSNGYYLGEIEEGTIPGGAVLIVKKNERITLSAATKSGDITYEFIDDVFDRSKNVIETKSNRHTGKYTTSWVEGQDPEDNSDIISAASLNKLNPDIIKSYNLTKNNSYALPNDYIYYGMTSSETKGRLRNDVRSKIVRFKISPNSINSLFDDPQDEDIKFSDSYETDDNGKGPEYEPTASEIYSKLWSEGKLEIRVVIFCYTENGDKGVFNDYFYDVKASDLFTVNDYAIKRERWGSTAFKWYITWRYSITNRDETTFTEKWYYPSTSPDLPTWDLAKNSSYFIAISENDTGTETSKTYTYSNRKADTKSAKISLEGSLLKLITVKNEFGWEETDERSSSTSTTISWKNGNDVMGEYTISYRDKYISDVTGSSYKIYSYGVNRFIFTILPYRY